MYLIFLNYNYASSIQLHLLVNKIPWFTKYNYFIITHVIIIYSILYKQIHIITRDYNVLRLQYPA